MSRAARYVRALIVCLPLVAAGVATAPAAEAGSTDTYRLTTTTGATMPTGDVDIGLHCYNPCATFVQAPFPVQLYGQTYRRLYVLADGTVQTTSKVDPDYRCAGSYVARGPIFLALRNTLSTYPSSQGVFRRTTGVAPHRLFILEWRAHSAEDNRDYTFATTFAEGSGVIQTTYGDVGLGSRAYIGAENSYGATATSYSCGGNGDDNNAVVSPGLRLTYTPAARTAPLAPPPRSFTVSALSPQYARATVTWQAPAGVPSRTVLGYLLTRDGRGDQGGGPFTSTLQPSYATSFSFGHLVPGHVYTFTVRVITSNGGWGQVARVRGGLPAPAG